MSNRLGIGLLVSAFFLAGCPRDQPREESPIDAIDAPEVAVPTAPGTAPAAPQAGDDAIPGVRLVVPAIPVHESVPRPEQYSLVSEVPGPGVRILTVETGEDARALAARFNQELQASGLRHEPLREEQRRDQDRFMAVGTVDTPEGRVAIGIRELRAGEGREPDSVTDVNYRVPSPD